MRVSSRAAYKIFILLGDKILLPFLNNPVKSQGCMQDCPSEWLIQFFGQGNVQIMVHPYVFFFFLLPSLCIFKLNSIFLIKQQVYCPTEKLWRGPDFPES
uniref:Uncharacterized protein n=1 Tax=Cacopsylla melanoneura TaxID=428564 RepID=A0A8D9E9F7_9HEMI